MKQIKNTGFKAAHIQVHALPILVKQNAQLLRAAQRKDGDEHLAARLDGVVHLKKAATLRSRCKITIREWKRMGEGER
jgi:hypothetical protein